MAVSASHCLPYAIKGARFSMLVPLLDADGDPTAQTTPDTEISEDNAAATDAAEEVSATSGMDGMGLITFSGAETDCSCLAVNFKAASGPKATLATLYPRVLAVVGSGTLSAGSAGGGTLGTLLAYDVTGCFIKTTGGTGGGGTGGANNQARKIVTYNTGTGAFTVSPNWETTPDATTTYEVLLPEGVTLGMLRTLNPTTAGRTLGVESNGKVTGVVLTDTVTTYTGNTPQTGDAFARLGAPAGASVSADVAAVKGQTAAIETDTQDLQSRTPSGTPGGANGAWILGDMTGAPKITNAAGNALELVSSGGNGHGLKIQGHGSGEGIEADGGASADGMRVMAGGSAGYGLAAIAQAANYAGVLGSGGDGGTAPGGAFIGGGNGPGIRASGGGSGAGAELNGGDTGPGLVSTGGATSGDGARFIAPTSGDGLEAAGAGGGADVNADITGNLSGSVGSVPDSPGVTSLLSRIPAALFSGITSLAQWLGLLAGKQVGNSTARTELRATGAGSGTYDETTDSQEALKDLGVPTTTTVPTANQNRDAVLAGVIEGTTTLKQSLQYANAANAGKLSGAATTAVAIRDLADTKDRIAATVDSSGNRSAVTLSPD